jgi:hypothetical protein
VQPWQLVFLVMAIPDLVLGFLMLTTVYEPPRRGLALAAGAAHRAAPIRAVFAHLWRERAAFGPMFLAVHRLMGAFGRGRFTSELLAGSRSTASSSS